MKSPWKPVRRLLADLNRFAQGNEVHPQKVPEAPQTARRFRDSSRAAGLGLVKRILELHGSAISVVSNPAAGTTFSFDLPATR